MPIWFSSTNYKLVCFKNVATSIAGRRNLHSRSRLYDLPRSEKKRYINDYNPSIKLVWPGNMDLQYIGEKSLLLDKYCNKYTCKSESSHVDFTTIQNNQSLASKLWNIGMRCLNNRECGALEAADTLLGVPLYGTDNDTIIRWVDVNEIRNRRVKSFQEIRALDKNSEDIYCPSLIDSYYPNRPVELELMNLYEFAKWYDVIKYKPKEEKVELYELAKGLYIKKRKKCYLINHYQHNVKTKPEAYFYSLLLLFKPWRNFTELKGGYETYAEAFHKSHFQLTEALKYHGKLKEIQNAVENAKELVEKRVHELNDAQSQKCGEEEMDFQPIEVEGAMKDLADFGEKISEAVDISQMISQLNTDQKRIFDAVTHTVQDNDEIIRLFVSGEGGTGKSFLIKTIKCWIKRNLQKNTAISAPTGIAAFNIDGLTIHRLFQLPVSHGGTPKYVQLSDMVLKTLRDRLKNVALFIIDEVSMISNVSLMYINLRLCEIFDTADLHDGWFGKKHILLFGDLLQLPPVHEDPAFIKLSPAKVKKFLGSISAFHLWTLFEYDELTINMRQENDLSYCDILSRIRIGLLTEATSDERLDELCDYMHKLPNDTVCLLPTRELCEVLNTSMLSKLHNNEIILVANDEFDCAPNMRKKINKILEKNDNNVSETAGIERIISIKIGAKVMIRRNIDVSMGLVNGTIGTITSVSCNTDDNNVESIKIITTGKKEFTIERVDIKFEVARGIFVFRKQFPLSLSYGITIHKSQGLTLRNAIIDIGTHVFTSGQIYVALSRVSTIEGLHLINFNPESVTVDTRAIAEYNRLRSLHKPDWPMIPSSIKRHVKVFDRKWTISKHVSDVQSKQGEKQETFKSWIIYGLRNDDNVSCYANVILQCIFHSSHIRQQVLKNHEQNKLKDLLILYASSKTICNSSEVRRSVNEKFISKEQQDASEFFTELCSKYTEVQSAVRHELTNKIYCSNPKCGDTSTTLENNYILLLPLPESTKIKGKINNPQKVQ